MKTQDKTADFILIKNARQNNLKNLNLKIPLGKFITVTGVSGSGKSSLAISTISAEGQRRYIETFSTYARQFMDKFPPPDVDSIEGIPPSISVEHSNPIRTSRSTIATISEISDFLKVLFSEASTIECKTCHREVKKYSEEEIVEKIFSHHSGKKIVVSFPISIPSAQTKGNNDSIISPDNIVQYITAQGFSRAIFKKTLVEITPSLLKKAKSEIDILTDIVSVNEKNRRRLFDSISLAYKMARGKLTLWQVHTTNSSTSTGKIEVKHFEKFSASCICPYCGIEYSPPQRNLFSYNSPLGACPACRGFGTQIIIDPAKVIPDERRSLREGAIRPWLTGYSTECYYDLKDFCKSAGIPMDVPYQKLPPEHKNLIWKGRGSWYGIEGYFKYLESHSYKMHYRVLLSRYRSYITCPTCKGTRFNPEIHIYRVDGISIANFYSMSISSALRFCRAFREKRQKWLSKSALSSLNEIISRLSYLEAVGVGYLTLLRETRSLSGGELARVGLASAIGSNLTSTLYVFDEPTVGLHPRDVAKLISAMKKLCERGNTCICVEHDLDVISSSDIMIDLGPGSAHKGGRVVYMGSPRVSPDDPSVKKSITLKYLTGKNRIHPPKSSRCKTKTASNFLLIKEASLRNLSNINVKIPLNTFTCITGVSGSGKTTLVRDVVYENIQKLAKNPSAKLKGCTGIEGYQGFKSVRFIDATPMYESPRITPATFTGIWGEIRKLLSQSPVAKSKNLPASFFSFNSGEGRCSRCGGAGYEKIEMQFLPDIHIQCPVCEGKRFTDEALEVKFRGKNAHEILSMSISEAVEFFKDHQGEGFHPLKILLEVGLGYLLLGQPFTTLSSGEMQRIKLAEVISGIGLQGKSLILMDEPTMGFHLEDVKHLLKLIQMLVDKGGTVVCIEHNPEFIKCSDWIIDLGPEGGEGGGRIVTEGTPQEVASSNKGYTSKWLKRAIHPSPSPEVTAQAVPMKEKQKKRYEGYIVIKGGRQNNLKNIDVMIPYNKFTLITGPSGSGKSSLVFDILFAEAQRRYIDTLSPYIRGYLKSLPHPELDHAYGLPPSVAIEQRAVKGGMRSTVGTITEISPFIRLLFARGGVRYCPQCNIEVKPKSPELFYDEIKNIFPNTEVEILAPVVKARKGQHTEVILNCFKAGCKRIRIDGKVYGKKNLPQIARYKVHFIEAVAGSFHTRKTEKSLAHPIINLAVKLGKGEIIVNPIKADFSNSALLSTKSVCPRCGRGFAQLDPRHFSFNSPLGACERCKGMGYIIEDEFDEQQEEFDEDFNPPLCPDCKGKRLKNEYLHVKLCGYNIAQLTSLPAVEAISVFSLMSFPATQQKIVKPLIKEILTRLQFLKEAGVGYLTLDRRARTLSGGEAQRVKISASLASSLRGVCYILDEPTIGLHPADNEKMIKILKKLCRNRNTVVVVEHDEDTIRSGDFCIELGPGAGKQGGNLLAAGEVCEVLKRNDIPTAKAFSKPMLHPSRGSYRGAGEKFIEIKTARANNLKNINVKIPLERLVCITGVSGSGKSTLMEEVILKGYKNFLKGKTSKLGFCDEITGFEYVTDVKHINSKPIGKTPRSVVATYIEIMNPLRQLFSSLPEARKRGFGPAEFSFNRKNGWCPYCKGLGYKKVGMRFLPLVAQPCEKCSGRRYRNEVLSIHYRGKSIADILHMAASEALEFFSFHPLISSKLKICEDVGVGYLHLGQASHSLSGGEAQRIKLVGEFSSTSSLKGRVYLLEEPTIGLHATDVERLIKVFHTMVDSGATVILIEHNLDIMAEADWIIDLGPEGGEKGGSLIAEGTPFEIIKRFKTSKTALFLRKKFNNII